MCFGVDDLAYFRRLLIAKFGLGGTYFLGFQPEC